MLLPHINCVRPTVHSPAALQFIVSINERLPVYFGLCLLKLNKTLPTKLWVGKFLSSNHHRVLKGWRTFVGLQKIASHWFPRQEACRIFERDFPLYLKISSVIMTKFMILNCFVQQDNLHTWTPLLCFWSLNKIPSGTKPLLVYTWTTLWSHDLNVATLKSSTSKVI